MQLQVSLKSPPSPPFRQPPSHSPTPFPNFLQLSHCMGKLFRGAARGAILESGWPLTRGEQNNNSLLPTYLYSDVQVAMYTDCICMWSKDITC